MYIPPTLRVDTSDFNKITNLCEEFLHIDETPEAKISTCCVLNKCVRKSVTCIARLTGGEYNDKNDKRKKEDIYTALYKNKVIRENMAVHAEMFAIYDTELRRHLKSGQVLTLYLTFQPCHFSGGHYKMKPTSCTEALIHFFEKTLAPLGIKLRIKFGYIYRAHWITAHARYNEMITNATQGLIRLSKCAEIGVIKREDISVLYNFFDAKTKRSWDAGDFEELMEKRHQLTEFMETFLTDLGL